MNRGTPPPQKQARQKSFACPFLYFTKGGGVGNRQACFRDHTALRRVHTFDREEFARHCADIKVFEEAYDLTKSDTIALTLRCRIGYLCTCLRVALLKIFLKEVGPSDLKIHLRASAGQILPEPKPGCKASQMHSLAAEAIFSSLPYLCINTEPYEYFAGCINLAVYSKCLNLTAYYVEKCEKISDYATFGIHTYLKYLYLLMRYKAGLTARAPELTIDGIELYAGDYEQLFTLFGNGYELENMKKNNRFFQKGDTRSAIELCTSVGCEVMPGLADLLELKNVKVLSRPVR
ncbi:ORF138 [Ranid herpesvirus 2]|uniref:ORF138 n=1 Tax=Ranid herpesvirus 2 TaxID=389214 RepID=Q14VW8_9VIRU|nr:ORF138 [Ranid herpesvirus 2]ABG25654.1 ORF138 [Ranid herpesvirus 2]